MHVGRSLLGLALGPTGPLSDLLFLSRSLKLQVSEQVPGGLLDRHIPTHGGHADDFKLGRVQGEEQSQGIIYARVGVENDTSGPLGFHRVLGVG